jgi:hypothetical protein
MDDYTYIPLPLGEAHNTYQLTLTIDPKRPEETRRQMEEMARILTTLLEHPEWLLQNSDRA